MDLPLALDSTKRLLHAKTTELSATQQLQLDLEQQLAFFQIDHSFTTPPVAQHKKLKVFCMQRTPVIQHEPHTCNVTMLSLPRLSPSTKGTRHSGANSSPAARRR